MKLYEPGTRETESVVRGKEEASEGRETEARRRRAAENKGGTDHAERQARRHQHQRSDWGQETKQRQQVTEASGDE